MASSHVIDIVINAQDQTSSGLRQAQNSLSRFDSAINRTQQRLQRMTQTGYKVTVGLIDRITTPSSRINQELHRLASRVHNITLGLQNRAFGGIRQVESKLASLTSKAYTVTVNMRDRVSSKVAAVKDSVLASTVGVGSDMLVGAGIGYGLYDTIKTYRDFEAQMSSVAAISGASGEELAKLTDKAKSMGATTSFSATEAGKAFEYMAMAGWKTADMTAGIEGIMDLAAASGEELGRVSDIVTDALTAFGLKAEDAGYFADVLAVAASNSNTTVGLMGSTFQQVAPLAGTLGYSVEDVATAIGLMANQGIKGERAGTALRGIFGSLINTSDGMSQKLESMGVKIKNADGTVVPFIDTLKSLRTAFAGLSQVDQASFASDLVGANFYSDFLAMMNAPEGDLGKLTSALADANGKAKEMSEIRMDNLSGDLTYLASSWESFQLALMSGKGSNFLREIVQGLKTDIDKITGYMQDGLDISDVGRIALDVLNQLKNKFLELDGVGSLLAGGALAAGLYKISKLALSIKDSLGSFGSTSISTTTARAQGGSSVGSMVVNAGRVTVNGAMASSGGIPDIATPGTSRPSGSTSQRGGAAPRTGGKLPKIAGAMGKIATPLMMTLSAYDVFSTSQDNDNRMLEADNHIAQSEEQATELEKAGRTTEASYVRQAAYANKSAVAMENETRMNQSVGGAVGTVAGSAIGGVIGSIIPGVGTTIGAMAGGFIGNGIGEMVGENWDGLAASGKDAYASISVTAQDAAAYISGAFSNLASSVSGITAPIADWFNENVWTPLQDGAITAINFVVGLAAIAADLLEEIMLPIVDWFNENVWTPIIEYASEVFATIGEIIQEAADWINTVFSSVADWFNENVWAPLASYTDAIWQTINGVIAAARDYLMGLWGDISAWFSATVWEPISVSVDSVKNAISTAFQSAYDSVTGIFSGLASWFDANVIAPVKAKFNEITEIGSRITGLTTSSEQKKADGGFVNNAQHTLIGEAGPEVVIPLSSSRRNRAYELIERTQRILGISDASEPINELESLFNGGNVDNNYTEVTSAENISNGSSKAGNISIELGGVNLSVNIEPTSESFSADDVISAIRNNLNVIADDIGGKLAETLTKIYANQPVNCLE